jgi:ribosomal protein L29
MEMEPLTLNPISTSIANIAPQEIHNFDFLGNDSPKPKSPFIEANTESVSLSHLKEKCVIPVWAKDNEITLSHQEFIETALSAIATIFPNETINTPEIRVSHQIKGRTPDALHVPTKDLQDFQRTSYFERMAFIIKIPGIAETINGNRLELTIGGVRAYNQENLYSKKTYEKYKFFIGFQNMVCCNLCVSTDGFQSEIRAMSYLDLEDKMIQVLANYRAQEHLNSMQNLLELNITERDFAQIIGKSRLYNYLPKKEKSLIPELLLNDGHINTVAKDYYQDESFCRNANGDISMWEFITY